MRVEYAAPVKPGDTIVVGGWCVLWETDRGKEVFAGVFPTHRQAQDYARAYYRSRNWRLLPCTGHVSTHLAACRPDGSVEMVIE